jgi:hypothetical protein
MRGLSIRLLIGLATFVIGVVAVSAWLYHQYQPEVIADPPEKSSPPAPSPASSEPCSRSPSERKIDALEAVRLAECFIAQNGYTDLPPMSDTSKLIYESFDDPPPAERALEVRRDTLERSAYSYGRDERFRDGWVVVFRARYRPEHARMVPDYEESLKKVGRCVTMDAYGNMMRVEHQDCYLRSPRLTVLAR